MTGSGNKTYPGKAKSGKPTLMNFSFQLYSARNFQPWQDVLAMLARTGYRNVEGFGGVYEDPSAFRALMDQNGLAMPSGHFSMDALEGDIDTALKTASTLGVERIFCPHIAADQRPTDKAGWQAFAARG
jgi:sugar phosphate isomerase/epimerase